MDNLLINNLNETFTDISKIENLFILIIINLFSAILIFTGFFFVFVNISKKIFSFRNMSFWKSSLVYFGLGFLFSSVCPILILISVQFNLTSMVLNQVVLLIIFSLLTSTFSYLGAGVGFIISNIVFSFTIGDGFLANQFSFIVIFYLLGGLWVFLNRFFFQINFKSVFLTSIALFLLPFLLVLVFFDDSLLLDVFINLISNYVLFLILYAISVYVHNLVNETYKLKSSIMYDSDYFVNSSYSSLAFSEYIKKSKAQSGLFLTFDFMNIENIITNEGSKFAENIKKNFIKYIFYNVGKEAFYFKTFQNEYGLFISLDYKNINLSKSVSNNSLDKRTEDDFLKKFEIILEGFPTEVDYNGVKYPVSIYCFAGLYGVHSCDFFELIKNNQNLKRNWDLKNYKNIIKLFHQTINVDNEDKKISKYFKENHDLNRMTISLVEQKIEDKNNVKYLFPKISWLSENIYSFEKLNKSFNNTQHLNFIYRNIAYRSLVLFNQFLVSNPNNDLLLAFYYPLESFANKSFRINDFLYKFSKNNINPKQIVFIFDLSKSKTINNPEVLDILIELKKNGFKFAFKNYSKNKINLKPDYLLNQHDQLVANKKD